MDRKCMEKSNDQALLDFETLAPTQHRLIFQGPLIWNLSYDHSVDMHVLLFEDTLILLQKQEDRCIPECHNTNAQPAHGDTFTNYRVIKLRNLLVRMYATDRSFFVADFSESSTPIYEFTAASAELANKWCMLISNSVEELKKSQAQKIGVDRNREPQISSKGRISNTVPLENITHPAEADLFEGAHELQQNLEIVDESSSQAGEVNAITETTVSAAVRSSLELLHHNRKKIETALNEQAHLLANFLHLSWDQYLAAVSKVRSAPKNEDSDDSLLPELLLVNIEMNDLCMKFLDISTESVQQQVDQTSHGPSTNVPVRSPAQFDNTSIAHKAAVTALDQMTADSSNLSSLLNQDMDILPKCEPSSLNRSSATVEGKEGRYAPGTAKSHCDSVRG